MSHSRSRPFDPAPAPGLRLEHFHKICQNGLGDGHNSYAHSMAWYKNRLYIGITRSNMCMLKLQSAFANTELSVWPVECPDSAEGMYKLDRRSQIWCYDPNTEEWRLAQRAPIVTGMDGKSMSRDIGYRSMAIFQGKSDPEPALYVSTWAPGRLLGGLILQTFDGEHFVPVTRYGILDMPIQTTRSLLSFQDRLFFSPTARKGSDGSQQNTAGLPIVFESDDPVRGRWLATNLPGFGELSNQGVFTMAVMGNQLYAGTFNLAGFQVWRSDCLGKPPYHWTKVIDQGAYRGPLNQAVASMTEFNGAMYVGSGIQGGGRDRINNIGPDAAELIRIWPDDSWDLVVGTARDTPQGYKQPLSGMPPGFGNFFNGYFWCLQSHDGWLYLGTCDWSVNLQWVDYEKTPVHVQRFVSALGVDKLVANQGGFDLWRTADGENWLPVSRRGFNNPYNWGVRNMVSTVHGLFVGTANVFAPKVAVRDGAGWKYIDNPDGGLEVWLGSYLAT